MRHFLTIAACLVALSSPQVGYAGGPSVAVPPGFEDLDKLRTVVLDLHYRGQLIGPVTVEMDGGKFRLKDPESVVGMLPLRHMPADELTRWHETNVGKICSRMASVDCGVLFPERIAFIVNEDSYRIDAFVGSDYIETSTQPTHLTPSHTRPSVTTVLDGSIAGNGQHTDYFVRSDIVAAMGGARATVVGAASSRDTLRAQEAHLEADHGSLRSRAGLFWSPTTSFLGRRRLVGIGTQTQWDTRVDYERAIGTNLDLTLPERSRVDVSENGRLLWTGFFDPGSARIDTRNFPEGAYPVTIRITGASGQVREDVRIFVKDNNLPAVGEKGFHIFAGLAGERSERGTRFNQPIVTASYIKRVSDHFAFGGNVVATEETALGEMMIDYAAPTYRVRSALMIGASGEKAISAHLGFKPNKNLAFDLSARRLWSDDDESILPFEDYGETNPLPQSRFLRLTGNYTQVIGSVSAKVGNGNLRLHGSYSSSRNADSVYSYGPIFEYPILIGRHGNLQFTGSALQTERAFSSFVGIRFFKALGTSALSGRAGYAHRAPGIENQQRNADDLIGNVAISTSKFIGDAVIRGTAGLSREAYGHDAHLDMELQTRRFSARAEALQNINGLDGQTQYAASFRTGIGISSDAFIITGESYAPAAIRVRVAAPQESTFDVFVGGRLAGEITSGESLSTFLEPYRDYDVTVRPKGRKQVRLAKREQKVTLFPGGVVALSFEAVEQFTIFGRLKGANGEVLPNTVLRTEHSIAVSDAEGYFQIDVVEGDDLRAGTNQSLVCSITLGGDPFQKVGDLKCE